MTKGNALTLLLAFVIGWLAVSFVMGTAIGLNAILLAFVVLVIVLILRTIDRADALYIVVGLIIGALISLLVPALRPTFVDSAVCFGVLLFASYKV